MILLLKPRSWFQSAVASVIYFALDNFQSHYNDVIMSTVASQITGVPIVCSSVASGADHRKHQSSASLAFVRGIHRWPVNSPHKRPGTWKMFSFDDVIMQAEPWCLLRQINVSIWSGLRFPFPATTGHNMFSLAKPLFGVHFLTDCHWGFTNTAKRYWMHKTIIGSRNKVYKIWNSTNMFDMHAYKMFRRWRWYCILYHS